MTIVARHVALCAIVLYALLGFASAACPASSDRLDRTHHHGHQAGHTIACAWACHAQTNTAAIDAPLSLVPEAPAEFALSLGAHGDSSVSPLYHPARAPPARLL